MVQTNPVETLDRLAFFEGRITPKNLVHLRENLKKIHEKSQKISKRSKNLKNLK
jgi:CRISPR/Cas system-associated endoribonuclease Cas2